MRDDRIKVLRDRVGSNDGFKAGEPESELGELLLEKIVAHGKCGGIVMVA